MDKKALLTNKKLLIVDDEPDVLSTLKELLTKCAVYQAVTFDEAKELLEAQSFDIAVLDIMGVDGYKLLEIANQKEILAVMLTAHALSPQDTVKSFKEGAAYFVPKDKMINIAMYLEDILEAKEKGKSPWSRWKDRFGAYYSKRFGPEWQKESREFWEKFRYYAGKE